MRSLPLVCFSLFAVAATAAALPGADDSTEPTAAQIESWVEDLSSTRFFARDVATRNLIAARWAAVKPVEQVITSGGLEAGTRGITILQELAICDEPKTEEAAHAALQRIASIRVTSAARRAHTAIERLDVLRQDRAIERLKQLGAKVIPNHVEIMALPREVFAIEITRKWKGTVDDLRWLRAIPDAEQISFIGDHIGDDWLKVVRDLENVLVVKIKRARITDAALAHVASLPELQQLKLLYVPITDASVEHLSKCKSLEQMRIFGSQLTADAAKELQEALGAEIDRRKGAFLGIGPALGDAQNLEWKIERVTDGSAADKAGLEVGDRIEKCNGDDVGTFEDLTTKLAAFNVGDTIEFEVLRQGETLTFEIALGEWD